MTQKLVHKKQGPKHPALDRTRLKESRVRALSVKPAPIADRELGGVKCG